MSSLRLSRRFPVSSRLGLSPGLRPGSLACAADPVDAVAFSSTFISSTPAAAPPAATYQFPSASHCLPAHYNKGAGAGVGSV